MHSAEILAELPHLDAQGRPEIFDRLCELQEVDLLQGRGPTDREKVLLDEALAGFERDGAPSVQWQEVIGQLIFQRQRAKIGLDASRRLGC